MWFQNASRHFPRYVRAIQASVLEREVLPQLLLGVRDESDQLVASTLRALADLVPVLGAAVVVGGGGGEGRRKIFADGAPSVSPSTLHLCLVHHLCKYLQKPGSPGQPSTSSFSPSPAERRSPIGAEKDEEVVSIDAVAKGIEMKKDLEGDGDDSDSIP